MVENIQVVDKVKILGIWFTSSISEEENFKLNFEPNFIKIRSICGQWSNRNLSIKGKITLITSLMISLLQFPCTAIHTPACVFTDFKKTMINFIWNGKNCKIAYNVMVQEIGRGGLKMPDLWTRVQVIHLNWVKYMWKNQNSLASSILTQTFSYQDIQSLLLCKTSFLNKLDSRYRMLRDILTTWSELHLFSPSNETEVQEESLWFNRDITIGKEQLCWRLWLNASITTVNHLLHNTLPRFLSHEELSEKYHINASFLQILQIRSSIPFPWRRLLTSQASQNLSTSPKIVTSTGLSLDISDVSSKKLYSELILRKQQAVASQRKWDLEFPPPPDKPLFEYWRSNSGLLSYLYVKQRLKPSSLKYYIA